MVTKSVRGSQKINVTLATGAFSSKLIHLHRLHKIIPGRPHLNSNNRLFTTFPSQDSKPWWWESRPENGQYDEPYDESDDEPVEPKESTQKKENGSRKVNFKYKIDRRKKMD